MRRLLAWYLAPDTQRLVWASIPLNAAVQFWPPARAALPDPMFFARLLGN